MHCTLLCIFLLSHKWLSCLFSFPSQALSSGLECISYFFICMYWPICATSIQYPWTKSKHLTVVPTHTRVSLVGYIRISLRCSLLKISCKSNYFQFQLLYMFCFSTLGTFDLKRQSHKYRGSKTFFCDSKVKTDQLV